MSTTIVENRGMMPLLGNEGFSSWSILGSGEKKGQYSSIVCIAGITDGGKTIQIAPFNWESTSLLGKGEGIVKAKLLATVEGTVGNVRLVASKAMIDKISKDDVASKAVKVVVNGTEDVLGKVVIADAIGDTHYKLLTSEFLQFGRLALQREGKL